MSSPVTYSLEPQPPRQPLAGGGMLLHAPAKINLDLLVGPRREDGFHPLDSLVAKVTLYDRIELRPRTDGQFTLDCRGADCGRPEKNLAIRAARLMAESRDATPESRDATLFSAENRVASLLSGLDIALEKHIPPGKGSGGGSSDAAAVLAGLNEFWKLNLSTERLCELGAQLGSDVPLFLGPPALRMTGRGERIEPVKVHPFIAVLFLSDLHCSTADVYRAFDEKRKIGTDPIFRPRKIGSVPIFLSQPPSSWRDKLQNDLAAPALEVCPPLGELWQSLQKALPVPVHMTGSGSALFCLCDDRAELEKVASAIPPAIPAQAVIVRSI